MEFINLFIHLTISSLFRGPKKWRYEVKRSHWTSCLRIKEWLTNSRNANIVDLKSPHHGTHLATKQFSSAILIVCCWHRDNTIQVVVHEQTGQGVCLTVVLQNWIPQTFSFGLFAKCIALKNPMECWFIGKTRHLNIRWIECRIYFCSDSNLDGVFKSIPSLSAIITSTLPCCNCAVPPCSSCASNFSFVSISSSGSTTESIPSFISFA